MRGAGEDGVISVVLALSMALFIALLAVILDLGQIWQARTAAASATTSAAAKAADILARGGCAEFDTARAAATDIIDQSTGGTATLDRFEVRYAAIVVTDQLGCPLPSLVDHNVGRVTVGVTDSRVPIFSSAFTSRGLETGAESRAEWGYVSAMAGGIRPMSLCTQHPAVVDYRTYLTQQATFETTGVDTRDPTLIDPFDIELDAYTGGNCEPNFGDLVNVDFSDSSADQTILAGWMATGAPYEIHLDNPVTVGNEAYCGDGTSNSVGECEGVKQADSTDEVAHVLPLVDQVFPILLHDTAFCHNGHGIGHCSSSGSRDHRAYPVDGFARVRMLCARITAYPTAAAAALVPDPDPASPTFGSDCVGLQKAAIVDGNPGDDVYLRLQFVVDTTVQEGNLVTMPWADNGFLGVSVCSFDGDSTCNF